MAVLFLAGSAVRQTEISYVVPPTPVTFLTLVCLLGVPEGVLDGSHVLGPSVARWLYLDRGPLYVEKILKNRRPIWSGSFQLYCDLLSHLSFFRKEEIQTYFIKDWMLKHEDEFMKRGGRDCNWDNNTGLKNKESV